LNGLYFLLPFILVAGLGLFQNSYADEITYDITDDANSVKFESSIESYVFDKNTCDLNVYEGGTVSDSDVVKHKFSNVLRESVSSGLYSDIALNSCTYVLDEANNTLNVIQENNGIKFETFYEFGIPNIEWTYTITNNNIKKTPPKFEVDFVCKSDDCGQVKNNGKTLSVGTHMKENMSKNLFVSKGGMIDTKDNVHKKFKEVDIASDKAIFKFGDDLMPLTFGKSLIIDPVYIPADYEADMQTDPSWTDTNANTSYDGTNKEYDETGVSSVYNSAYYNLGQNVCDGTDDCVIRFSFTRNNNPTDTANGDIMMVSVGTNIGDTLFNTGDLIGLQVTQDHTTSSTNRMVIYAPDGQYVYQNQDITAINNSNYFTVGTDYYVEIKKVGTVVYGKLCTDSTFTSCPLSSSVTASGSQTGMNILSFSNMLADSNKAGTQWSLNYVKIWDGVSEVPFIPNAVTDLTFANLDNNSVDLIWTEPGLNNGTVVNYMVNSTTPWGSSTNFLANSTNLYYNVTGLNFGTPYSFSASVLTEGGYNFTGNILNITTPSTVFTGVAPTGLTVNDCYHACTTQLNLEWLATLMDNINGFRIFFETPIGNGFTTLTSNTTTATTYYNHTGLISGQFYNYKVAALNGSGISENSTTYSANPHHLPDSVDDLTVTTNSLLQFLLSWSAPNLYGTLSGYNINYTTPAGDPQTVYVADTGSATTSATISGLDPTTEYSFRVSAVTNHGSNVTGANIPSATLTVEIAVGDLTFDVETNPDTTPIWYELYNVNPTTDDVQVRFASSLNVDCTVSERIAGTNTNYTSLSETAALGYVYHNFTVINAGNDILDWNCWDHSDPTINGQYSLTQSLASSGAGGISNVPLFSQINNFSSGLYGTDGKIGGIDLITMFIVIVSMLGFNRTNPALGVGIMVTMLGAAWYFELIPWTSGMLGGIALVVVLAIGMGLKKRD